MISNIKYDCVNFRIDQSVIGYQRAVGAVDNIINVGMGTSREGVVGH